MNPNNVVLAKAFYTAMSEKNIKTIEKYVHPDIHFSAPLAKLQGKEAYLEALKGFMAFFKTLTIRSTFAEGDEAVVIYEVDFPAPVGKLPSAALLTFHEGLIIMVELFYDARSFGK
jgi:ketosteroid isomerase-like protein